MTTGGAALALRARLRRGRGLPLSWLAGIFGPGRPNPLARRVDRWASQRVLENIIRKTDDVSTVRWLGRPIWQYPLDAWVIQEMVGAIKPDLIVETGTYLGGSAFFLANLCDLLGHGNVISIDIAATGHMAHPRITYLAGSSVDPGIIAQVADAFRAINGKHILVILDSAHDAEHVLRELESYAPLIPTGDYIHVQDGCIDELAMFGAAGTGPATAAQRFLASHQSFERDIEPEHRYVMTAHPWGWLRRVSSG